MKPFALAFFFLSSGFAQIAGRTVYVLPMAGGLDQYLAGEIARAKVMQVVADPKAADLVLTDRLGEAFEQKMAKIHPRDDDDADAGGEGHVFRSSGSRGTIFLVDAKSRQVVWSDYEKPGRSASDGALNREASRIAKKLREMAK